MPSSRKFTSLFTSQKGKINENFIWRQLYNRERERELLSASADRFARISLLLPGIAYKFQTEIAPQQRIRNAETDFCHSCLENPVTRHWELPSGKLLELFWPVNCQVRTRHGKRGKLMETLY